MLSSETACSQQLAEPQRIALVRAQLSGCAYRPPPALPEQIDWILQTLAGEAVQRVCLSCPPPTPPPPPEPDEFAHLVTEQAGLVHFSGCAYHPHPPTHPEQIDWILHIFGGEAVQRVCLSCPPPPHPPPPEPDEFAQLSIELPTPHPDEFAHLGIELQRVCLSCPPPTPPHPQNHMNLHIWVYIWV